MFTAVKAAAAGAATVGYGIESWGDEAAVDDAVAT
jgi:hypothetical protein